MPDMNAVMKDRYVKLEELKKLGVNPYKNSCKRNNLVKDVYETASKLKKEDKSKKKFTICGRILAFRSFGKLIFTSLADASGKVQLFVRRDRVGDERFKIFSKLDVGDIIEASGVAYKTQRGEPSLFLREFKLLTKSLRPLPDKWKGLKDTEIKYRQRYVDLIMNPEVKKTFRIRSEFIQAMREYLLKEGYLEVDTPTLQPIYGGGLAKPFETFHNELKRKMYLRISDELYLKRLIVGGYEKVFEFCKDFRNEGIDTTHNPEFSMMETMWAYADYEDNMDFCERMMEWLAKKVLGTTEIIYQGKKISLKRPWKRMAMSEALKKHAGIDMSRVKSVAEARRIAKGLGVKVRQHMGVGAIMQEIFSEKCEDKLVQPTFLYGYPAETSPLSKRNDEDPDIVDRFEVFIMGKEYGNSYTELNNPVQQREAFEEGVKKKKKGDEEAHVMDKDYIRALEYGMPPTSGLGLGIDRWIMLFTNSQSIRDVVFFPTLRKKE